MTAANLGVIFSPVVFGEDEAATIESVQNSAKVRSGSFPVTVTHPLTSPPPAQDLVMEVLISQHVSLFEGLPADLAAGRLSRAPSGSASRALSPTGDQQWQQVQQIQQQVQQLNVNSQTSDQQQQLSRQPSSAQEERPSLPPSAPSSSADAYDIDAARQTRPDPPAMPPVSSGMTHDGSGDSVYQLYQTSSTALLHAHEPTLSPVPQRPVFSSPSVTHTRSSSLDHNLSTPSPPLSAAGGRHVPLLGDGSAHAQA